MFSLKYAPCAIPAAISGLAIVSGLVIRPGDAALIPYSPNSLLTRQQLRQLDYHKIGAERQFDGLFIEIRPQSTQALHSILGFPVSFSEGGDTEYYVLEGTPGAIGTQDHGYMEPTKISVQFLPDPNSQYLPKATFVFIPKSLLKQQGE